MKENVRKNFSSNPPNEINTSLIHKVNGLYVLIYSTEKQIPKRDRFGIFLKIENVCLELFENTIAATFQQKYLKEGFLKNARTKIEVLKHLIRTSYELRIIRDEKYFQISSEIIEISKMINGWIKYLEKPL